MSIRNVLLASAVLAVSAGAAQADGSWRQKQIDDMQAKEAREIEDGRYRGDLTRREYRQLLGEQERIKQIERAAQADGHISRREFRDIREAQEVAEKHIKSETGDGQVSFWRRWMYRSRY